MCTMNSISRLALLAALSATIAATPVTFASFDAGGLTISKAFAKDSDQDDDRGDDGDDDRGQDDDDRERGSEDDHSDDDRSTRASGEDDSIEVSTSDGGRIEIENGRFERKNAAGRTIEERPARASDFANLGLTARIATASGAARQLRGQGQGQGMTSVDGSAERPVIRVGSVVKVEVYGRKLEVTYSRGWKEEIENGRYELKDPANRTVIERTATAADRERLSAIIR